MLQQLLIRIGQTLAMAGRSVLAQWIQILAHLGSMLGNTADRISRLLFMEVKLQPPRKPDTIQVRLSEIANTLHDSGTQAQALIEEAEELLDSRARRVEEAQRQVAALETEVEATQQRLEHLRAIKPESAEAISSLMNESLDTREQRAGRRDLVLFVLGATFSGILWVISEFFLR